MTGSASSIYEVCLAYFIGKRRLIDLGYAPEIDRQEDAFFEQFDGVRQVLHGKALSHARS